MTRGEMGDKLYSPVGDHLLREEYFVYFFFVLHVQVFFFYDLPSGSSIFDPTKKKDCSVTRFFINQWFTLKIIDFLNLNKRIK